MLFLLYDSNELNHYFTTTGYQLGNNNIVISLLKYNILEISWEICENIEYRAPIEYRNIVTFYHKYRSIEAKISQYRNIVNIYEGPFIMYRYKILSDERIHIHHISLSSRGRGIPFRRASALDITLFENHVLPYGLDFNFALGQLATGSSQATENK